MAHTSRIPHELYREIVGSLNPQELTRILEPLQDPKLFRFQLEKFRRLEKLRSIFSNFEARSVFLSRSLYHAGVTHIGGNFNVHYLEKEFFVHPRPELPSQMDGGVLIFTNNDVLDHSAFMEFYESNPSIIYCGWDWDNHHWLSQSIFLAAHSDFYFPAHRENLYLLSRFNGVSGNTVLPCSVIQWSKSYINEASFKILNASRDIACMGAHVFYSQFKFRNSVLATINQKVKSIGLRSQEYWTKNPEERLDEWLMAKSHWIVPVLNDTPIRIFDALITGGFR